MLVDADLRGLLVGMTLATKPAEIYRALIEATAFGTRVIVEAFESGGVAVDTVVACGGLPERNKLLMQIYADVLGREIAVGASTQAPALGAAMFAAVAAGEYALDRRGRPADDTPEHRDALRRRPRRTRCTTSSTREYVRLHDLFGRGGDDAMRNLKRLPVRRRSSAPSGADAAARSPRRKRPAFAAATLRSTLRTERIPGMTVETGRL